MPDLCNGVMFLIKFMIALCVLFDTYRRGAICGGRRTRSAGSRAAKPRVRQVQAYSLNHIVYLFNFNYTILLCMCLELLNPKDSD